MERTLDLWPWILTNTSTVPDPGFFLLCPHGVGTLSFTYYLTLIGAPSSFFMPFYKDGKIVNPDYPVQKSTIYIRGISCDRVLLDYKPLSYGNNQQKIIQLIRDPIDQLTSCINFNIAASIYGDRIPAVTKNSILEFMNIRFHTTCMFTSMTKSVSSHSDIFYIDTKDISGAQNCQKTMCNVSEYLTIPHIQVDDGLYNISYNSFKNRLWFQLQKQKKVDNGHINHVLSKILIFPSELHDFAANTWYRSHILDVFSYNNEEYIVSLPESYFNEIDSKKPIWDENKREGTKKYLDIFLAQKELCEQLYRKYVMTWEDLVSLIRSEPRFRSRFLRLMEREISLPLKNVPEKVEQWTHFHSLW